MKAFVYPSLIGEVNYAVPVTFVENAEVAMQIVVEDGCMVMAAASTRLGWIKRSLLALSKRALTFHSAFISTVAMIL